MTNFAGVLDAIAAIDKAEAAFGPVSQLTRDRRAALELLEGEVRTFGASPSGARRHVDATLIETINGAKVTGKMLVNLALEGARAVASAEVELAAKAILSDAVPVVRNQLTATFAAELVEYTAASVRPAVLAAFSVIDECAPLLPLTVDDSLALRSGGQIEVAWRRTIAAAAVVKTAIELRGQWLGAGWYPRAVRDPHDSFLLHTNPFLTDDMRLLGGGQFGDFGKRSELVPHGFASTLPTGFEQQLLELSRRHAIWHWPTPDEQSIVAGRFIDADATDQRRMAGMEAIENPMPTQLGRATGSNDEDGDAGTFVAA